MQQNVASPDTSVEPYNATILAPVGASARKRRASAQGKGSPEQMRRRKRLCARWWGEGEEARRAARSVGVSVRCVAPWCGSSAAAQRESGSVARVAPAGGRRRLLVCLFVMGGEVIMGWWVV